MHGGSDKLARYALGIWYLLYGIVRRLFDFTTFCFVVCPQLFIGIVFDIVLFCFTILTGFSHARSHYILDVRVMANNCDSVANLHRTALASLKFVFGSRVLAFASVHGCRRDLEALLLYVGRVPDC